MLTAALLALSTLQGKPRVFANGDAKVWFQRQMPGVRGKTYPGNQQPLAATAFRPLPISAIRPEGWLRKQLQLEADGFTGHLTEISPWLVKKDNAWLSPTGEGKNGWEEVPYWLKGFGDLGYVLRDPRIIDEAKTWINGVLNSQRSDGWLGPRANLLANKGRPDMWPNMPMLDALESYHDYTGDARVIKAMSAYFRWQLDLPESDFYLSYWEKHRGGDNILNVYWLYNKTREPWLLDLAEKIHRRTADWTSGVPDWHGVNFAQAFREPAAHGMLTLNPKDVEASERDYRTMRAKYGEVPGGMYGADENARPGFTDPRQAAETCAMVEMMLSDEELVAETGNPIWADRCEDVTFNSLPASMTADEKALHYLTAPNMPLIDRKSRAPDLQNSGPMLAFDPYDHRCCQHNVSHGWPYFSEHLWMASGDNGLAAVLYAPSEVTAKAGDGTAVSIKEETQYPFRDTVTFRFTAKGHNRFPFTVRTPGWCAAPVVTLNGARLKTSAKGSGFLTIDRPWRSGDKLVVRFPRKLEIQQWPAQGNAETVNYGPLTFSLKIGEKYVRSGGTDKWPAFEVHPTTPWNYGLEGILRAVDRPFPTDNQPFRAESAPVQVIATGRRIPAWTLDHLGVPGRLQPSPILSREPSERITLIPMGAARLRISQFPAVHPGGRPWVPAPQPRTPIPAKASHCFEGDTVDALTDGLLPNDSNDESIPRFTWWDHKGSTEWVELDYPSPRTFTKAAVYWFDDRRTRGGCRVPQSWRLFAEVDGEWVPVQNLTAYSTLPNVLNEVTIRPSTARRFRIEAQLQTGFSSGILEWMLK